MTRQVYHLLLIENSGACIVGSRPELPQLAKSEQSGTLNTPQAASMSFLSTFTGLHPHIITDIDCLSHDFPDRNNTEAGEGWICWSVCGHGTNEQDSQQNSSVCANLSHEQTNSDDCFDFRSAGCKKWTVEKSRLLNRKAVHQDSFFLKHWMSFALLQFPDDPARFLRRKFGVGGQNNGHGLQSNWEKARVILNLLL